VETHAGDFEGKSFRVFHRVRKADGTLVALGESTIVAFDYATHKTASVPTEFLNALEEYRRSR
jgi:acyl-CoA thioester hydrolase